MMSGYEKKAELKMILRLIMWTDWGMVVHFTITGNLSWGANSGAGMINSA